MFDVKVKIGNDREMRAILGDEYLGAGGDGGGGE
jgi:hypothetical protein